jgi:hypothetical protein
MDEITFSKKSFELRIELDKASLPGEIFGRCARSLLLLSTVDPGEYQSHVNGIFRFQSSFGLSLASAQRLLGFTNSVSHFSLMRLSKRRRRIKV